MQPLTHHGQEQLRNIAQRYGVSLDAATNLLEALLRGNGSMAQFNHPELGGYGQWMRGGMIMLGDMFNNGLKSTVDGLCNELWTLVESGPFVPVQAAFGQQQSSGGGSFQAQYSGGGATTWGSSSNWWPGELGQPSSSGAQNELRYAYFAMPRRLAIEHHGAVTVYDTLDHQIGGVSQQQGGGQSLSFTSQYGTVDLRQLPIVSGAAPAPPPQAATPPQAALPQQTAPTFVGSPANQMSGSENEQDIFTKIERLAALRDKGVLSEEEFANKKAELLARI